MSSISNIQISETGSEPVSLAEVKDFAVVDHSDDDALLTDMLTSAREDIEQELCLKLVDSDITVYIDTTKAEERIYKLPYAMNLSQVSAFAASNITPGETDEALSLDDDYYLNGSLIFSSYGTFKSEYTVTPVVPSSIKEAIKMLVAYRYNNRGDQDKQMGLPEDIERKISKFRQIWL